MKHNIFLVYATADTFAEIGRAIAIDCNLATTWKVV